MNLQRNGKLSARRRNPVAAKVASSSTLKIQRNLSLVIFVAFGSFSLKLSSALSFPKTQTRHQRKFQFVDYGAEVGNSNEITIACDGRVPGASLEVSHWNGNDTPDALYADTSTEMALNLCKILSENGSDNKLPFSQQKVSKQDLDMAVVVNNHFDTDGVCSVYALVAGSNEDENGDDNLYDSPTKQQLLIEAAESGDFDEWNSDRGLKLELTLSGIYSSVGGNDEQAYQKALAEMPQILDDFVSNEGAAYEDLWKDGFDRACRDYESIQAGNIRLQRLSKDIVAVLEETPTSRMSPYALYRGLKDQALWDGTTRILRINEKQYDADNSSSLYKYSYEKIGHGWVNKLVQRHTVPPVDAEGLVDNLNRQDGSLQWSKGGASGLTAICQTTDEWTTLYPKQVATQLAELDEGCEDSIVNDDDDDTNGISTASSSKQQSKSALQRWARKAFQGVRGSWKPTTSSIMLGGWNRLMARGKATNLFSKTGRKPAVTKQGQAMAVVMAISGGGVNPATSPVSNVWILPALVCATAYAFYNLFIKKASSSTSAPIDPILGGVLLQLVAAMMGASLYFWKKLTTTAAAAQSTKAFTGSILQNGGVMWSVAAGVAVGAAEILSFIISGMGVPASKSIPTVIGGSVVVGTLAGSVWLKERLSVGGWIGVLLIALGIALVGMDPGSAAGHP